MVSSFFRRMPLPGRRTDNKHPSIHEPWHDGQCHVRIRNAGNDSDLILVNKFLNRLHADIRFKLIIFADHLNIKTA